MKGISRGFLLLFFLMLLGKAQLACAHELAPIQCPDTLHLSNVIPYWLKTYHVIVLAETHGSNEYPQAFYELVCGAARDGTPLIVGLEIPETALESAMNVSRAGFSALAGSVFWAQSRDGKSSVAYFELIQKIKNLIAIEKIQVIGFDRRVTGKEDFGRTSYDFIENASANIKHVFLGRKPVVLLLTGNGHVQSFDPRDDIVLPFADSGRRVLILRGTSKGGNAWNCEEGICGVHRVSDSSSCNAQLQNATARAAESETVGKSLCVGFLTAARPLLDSK